MGPRISSLSLLLFCHRLFFKPPTKPSFRPKRRTVSPSVAQWRNPFLAPCSPQATLRGPTKDSSPQRPAPGGCFCSVVARPSPIHKTVISTEATDSFTVRRAVEKSASLPPLPASQAKVRLRILRRDARYQPVAFVLSSPVLQPIQETGFSTRSDGQSHRPSHSREIPAFRLCFCPSVFIPKREPAFAS